MFAFVIYEREIPISSRNKTQELKHLEANSLMKQSHFLSILEPRIEPSDRLKIRRFLSKLLPLVCQISSHSESMFGTWVQGCLICRILSLEYGFGRSSLCWCVRPIELCSNISTYFLKKEHRFCIGGNTGKQETAANLQIQCSKEQKSLAILRPQHRLDERWKLHSIPFPRREIEQRIFHQS